jgi:hypothetical protein
LKDRADPQNNRDSLSTTRIAKRPGTEIREELTFDGHGVRAISTAEAVDRWATWYEGQRDTAVVARNVAGERAAFRTPNRFTPEYREMLYARAQALERGLRKDWGSMLHTVMVTLTCSTTDEQGRPKPLVDHLLELLSSWEAVRRALSRVFDGRDWEYLAILEPHESGHAHIHLGVFVRGPVVAEQFQDVLDAHLRNCPGAGEEAHQIGGESDSVRVKRASHPSRSDGIENLGAYLASYMAGEYGAEATQMPCHVQRFYAAVWATGTQWFRPSNGAQEYMQPPDEDDPGQSVDWELVGIAPDGDLEEVVEVDPEAAGGVDYRRLEPPPGG